MDWTDVPVLVTGGRGLIGAELVLALLLEGAAVTVLDDASRPGGREVAGATYVRGDAGDPATLTPLVNAQDVIFNLAARVAGVAYNQQHHGAMLAANLRLQLEPLRACAYGTRPQTFIQVSSVCVYGPDDLCPAVETAAITGRPTGANAGYAWAKRLGEITVEFFTRPDLRVVIARPTNAYGPGDNLSAGGHVIPDLLRQVCDPTQPEVIINGTGSEIREFIHARDVAEGLLALADRGRHGQAYNLGTHGTTAVPIGLLARWLCEAAGVAKPTRYVKAFDGGDDRRWTNCTKVQQECGWHYRIGLQRGLAEMVTWYRQMLQEVQP